MSSKMLGTLLLMMATSFTIIVADRNIVPVVIWGLERENLGDNPSAFAVKSSGSLIDFLLENIEPTTPIIVFYKDDLCTEDLTQNEEKLQTLSQMGMKYMGRVKRPFEALQDFPTHNVTMIEPVDYVTNGQLAMTEVENLDGVVKSYQSLKNSSPNLVGILTGTACRFAVNDRSKRETDNNNSTEVIISEMNVLIYLREGISFMSDKKSYVSLGAPNSVRVTGNGNVTSPQTIKLIYTKGNEGAKLTVTLEVVSETSGYWTLKQIILDDKILLNASVSNVAFPTDFSYQCAEDIEFMDNYLKPKNKIKLSGLQMQIFAGTSNPKKFSDPYDCVGFVTIPILTGLFVTFIFALIVTWGLVMILDIKTMDRFDDPKGKTITIFANE